MIQRGEVLSHCLKQWPENQVIERQVVNHSRCVCEIERAEKNNNNIWADAEPVEEMQGSSGYSPGLSGYWR